MNVRSGVDTTRPVQLRPNGPDKRTEYAVPMSDGFLHVVTASHYVYDNEFECAGTLYVHIGCSVMIKDTVRDGETHWEAIRRVVTTWQAEQREQDHAEALEIVAMVDAQCAEADHPAETVEPTKHTPTLPENGYGRWTVLRAGGIDDAMTGYGYAWAYSRARYISEGIVWMAGKSVRVEFIPFAPAGDPRGAAGDRQVDEWTA